MKAHKGAKRLLEPLGVFQQDASYYEQDMFLLIFYC